MLLHEDKDSFEYLLTSVSIRSGIDSTILEKDYYVTVFLGQLAEKQAAGCKAFFKGGTALYKFLRRVGRFSEDIDITVDTSGLNRTQNDKQLALVTKKYVGFERLVDEGVTNKQNVLSVYAYDSLNERFSKDTLDRFGKVKVEATSFTISEPVEDLEVSSLLYDFATDAEKKIMKKNFNIHPFCVKSITLERMFIDKLFAAEAYVCRLDHEDKGLEASKHLYDLSVMSRLPRIQSFLSDEIALENMIKIQMREEKNRLGGVPDLLPKDFSVFGKIVGNEKLYGAFLRMEDIYVLYEKDRFSVNVMLDSMNRLYDKLCSNRSWCKDYIDDIAGHSNVDHSDVAKKLEQGHDNNSNGGVGGGRS